ncbi:putative cytochrome c oxidase subunit 3 [Thalassocella blandensis]|nr:putative cytochrome c oxidase subunit 3 [Thalassocella blandensis]
MKVFSEITEKSWLTPSYTSPLEYSRIEEGIEIPVNKKPVLVILLVIISVFFTLFVVTFIARSQYPDFQALAGDYWQPFYNPQRLWLNSSFLLASSIVLEGAVYLLRHNKVQWSLLALGISLLLALQFIASQLLLFQYLINLGFDYASNPANSYFYLLTSLHAIHLLAGIVVLGWLLVYVWRSNGRKIRYEGISLCALYWHYLLVLWIFLVLLTTSSPGTYAFIAALCGVTLN